MLEASLLSALLEMRSIRKSFSGVEVLHGVDLDLRVGEVLGLVGENGAGKSTLMKILGGVHVDHAGEIRLDGAPVKFLTPREAQASGVRLIHQELSLVPAMTVAENILLGSEPTTRLGLLDRGNLVAAAERAVQAVDPDLDVHCTVESLPQAAQQLVEVAKALAAEVRILVMDEPTSSLGKNDVDRLFQLIRRLKTRGVGIIYISHKLEEIYAVADCITVLRDGARIGTAPAGDLPPEKLIQWMVGRRIEHLFPKEQAAPGEELLRLEGCTLKESGRDWNAFEDIHLRLRAGEILGLAGLRGAGTSMLLGAIFGRFGKAMTGRMWIRGEAVLPASPAEAIARGVALVTNDRKESGLVLPMNVVQNITLASLERATHWGFLSPGLERRVVESPLEDLDLRAHSLDAAVETLSGGNQQKVILARWILTGADILLLDEPTRGIDVGAKSEIYRIMNAWTAAGKGILLITSELQELLAMGDRILVLHRGRATGCFTREEATQEEIAHSMTTSREVSHG